jgi:hypothetical protein
VQLGSLRHQDQPTARAIRERFGLVIQVLGVAAVVAIALPFLEKVLTGFQ